MQAQRQRRFFKPLGITVVVLLTVGAAVLLREYLMLRRLSDTFSSAKTDIVSEEPGAEKEKIESVAAAATPLVYQVKTSADGNRVDARVSFKAFKRMVEANPRLVNSWGRIGWKVLGDVPALCLRSLAAGTAFAKLGVQSGDCITHFDGETVNQPLRNLGIWLTLGSRRHLKVDTLRAGQRITYNLSAH